MHVCTAVFILRELGRRKAGAARTGRASHCLQTALLLVHWKRVGAGRHWSNVTASYSPAVAEVRSAMQKAVAEGGAVRVMVEELQAEEVPGLATGLLRPCWLVARQPVQGGSSLCRGRSKSISRSNQVDAEVDHG